MIPDPPYLIEFRVARELMALGNIGPAMLGQWLSSDQAYFSDTEKADFRKCDLCVDLLTQHPKSFIKPITADYEVLGSVADKLISTNKLTSKRLALAKPTLQMVAIAARMELTAVVKPQSVLWDNMAAYKAGAVPVIDGDELIASLSPP